MDYYTNNAKAYVESTLHVDMQPLYQRFLPLLPERAHILDAVADQVEMPGILLNTVTR